MAEFRDKLFEASYRGVPFVTTESSFSTGRRAARHVFPLRDRPYVEDLGRSVEVIRMTGFTRPSDDYAKVRDDMIRRCREPGAGFPNVAGGTLVHPYLGHRRVLCTRLDVTESFKEGRIARFQFEFVEVAEPTTPVQRRDRKGEADARATAAEGASAADLEARLEPRGPESVRLATSAKLAEFGQGILSLDVFSEPGREAAALQRSALRLISNATELATAPADLTANVLELSRGILAALPLSARGAFFAYETLLQTRPTMTSGTASSGAAANLNSTLTANLIRTAAAGGAVRSGARATFNFLEEALEARSRISTEIDLLSESTGDDDRTYSALLDLRAILIEAVPPLAEQLPSLRSIVLSGTMSTLQLAYAIYDDVTRESEIQARNRISHPAFISADVPVELLVDG